jgi:multicomponent Na+:H+ antiporter subunit E
MLPSSRDRRSALWRVAFFFSLWLMTAGWQPKDLPVGIVAACGASCLSLALAPPRDVRLRVAPIFALVVRFLRGSIVAGFDVAFRALASRLRLAPGFVSYPLDISAGDARNVFCFYQSLQPGVLPTGIEGDVLMIHGLDVSQPIAATVAQDEALFKKATAS